MAEAKRAASWSEKRDPKTTGGPTAAIVALFTPEPQELDRPKPVLADALFFLD